MAQHSMEMKVSQELSTDNLRNFVQQTISRMKPGIRHIFMEGGTLREGVKVKKVKTSLKVTI